MLLLAGGPVFPLVPEVKEEYGIEIRGTVDYDVAAGIVPLDGVVAFGRLVVTGFDFRSHRILAKRNPVRLDDILAASQVHLAFRLFYENVVNG